MKALTLWQPWASLVAHGFKKWETRSWAPPRGIEGQFIAIHSSVMMPSIGRRFMNDDAVSALLRPIYPDFWVWQHRQYPAMGYWRYRSEYGKHQLPNGVVLAIARVNEVVRSEHARPNDLERHFGDYTPGRWIWKLSDVHFLRKPVVARGRQKLWDLADYTEQQVIEQATPALEIG